jgi:hypothetical protein
VTQRKKQETRTAPQVGIVFSFDDKLWIERTVLEKAGDYGKFKIHEGDHVIYWGRLILKCVVPQDLEYEHIPRGRVAFNTFTKRYRLMLDRCILRQKNLVAAIKRQMGLPQKETDTLTDPHYRCGECVALRSLD